MLWPHLLNSKNLHLNNSQSYLCLCGLRHFNFLNFVWESCKLIYYLMNIQFVGLYFFITI
jgi:hypothetical protein